MIKFFYANSMVDTDNKFLLGCIDSDANIHTFAELFEETWYSCIRALSCFKALYVGEYEGKSYAEYIVVPPEETSAEEDVIFVDLAADDWSDTEKQLISAWLTRPDILVESLPVCYNIIGTASMLSKYRQFISTSCSNIVFTESFADNTVIAGAKIGNQVIGAYKILTNSDAYAKLCQILGTTCKGCYWQTYTGKPYAYAILPEPIDPNLNVLVMPVDEYTDQATQSILVDERQKLTSGIDINCLSDAHLTEFDEAFGKKEAYYSLENASSLHIFTRDIEGKKCIFAASIQGSWISLADIVSLQNTYDLLADALGPENVIKDHFSEGANGPTVMLELSSDITVSAKIADERNIPVEVYDELNTSFKKITEEGFSAVELTSDIANTNIKGTMFANLGIATGDLQAAKSYKEIYQRYNPTLESKVQTKPTEMLSRAMPTYEQLCQVYEQADTELDSEIDNDENEGQTDYFSSSTDASLSNVTLSSYEDLDMHIDSEGIQVESIFKYYDCVHLHEAVKALGVSLDYKLIEGNSANNTMGLCENELEFYLALRNLMLYGICNEHKIYTLAGLREALQKGISSKVVSEFLQDMAREAYALNWTHTGHVYSTSLVNDADADDSNVTPGVSFPGYYSVEVVNKDGVPTEVIKQDSIDVFRTTASAEGRELNLNNPVDGWQRIKAYVETHTLNSYAWIEAVVRLLRWGARKPDSLYIPSVDPKVRKMYLNMQSLVISDFSGSFDLCSPDAYKTKTGDTSYTLGLTVNTHLGDPELSEAIKARYNIEIPVDTIMPCGFALFTTYEDSTITKQTFIDVFTTATLISTGALSVLGITFDAASQTFSSDAEGMTVFANVKQDGNFVRTQVSYSPEEHFSLNESESYSVEEILQRNISSPQAYAIYTCKFLLRPMQLLSVYFEGINTKVMSSFSLLKKFMLRYDQTTYDACMDLLKVNASDKVSVESYKNNLKQDMNLQSMDIFGNILFEEYVLPLYAKLIGKLSSTTTLAELLTQALAVLKEADEQRANASKVTTEVSFADVINDCEQYYVYCHPKTKEPLFYGAKPKIKGKFVLWSQEDNIAVPANAVTKTIVDMYSMCIGPAEFTSIWKPALSKGATPQMRSKYEAMLKKCFITPKSDTYTKAIMTCVRVNKELKS